MKGLIRSYLDHLLVERGSSAHTIAGYRRDLERYATFLAQREMVGRKMPEQEVTEWRETSDLAAINAEDVRAFAASLHEDLAPSSAARVLAAVRSFHKFLLTEGIAKNNPAAEVKPPKIGSRLPKALDIAQVQAMLQVPDRDTVPGMRDAALLELLYGTGARVSEVLALDVDDFTLGNEAGVLRLFGKGRKERIVPLGSYARDAVNAWLVRGRPTFAVKSKRDTAALLLDSRGNRLGRQRAWAITQQCAQAAQIPEDVSPHTLRHSFATHLLDGGADIRVVQELLGHSSVTTTQIYTKVTLDHLREVFAVSHPRAR